MANEIERVIYRLELDGSAYIEGADKLSASTRKLTSEQEKANQRLVELQKQQLVYKKSLEETNAVIKANELETIELTKQLNALKEAGKGTSIEAKNLQAALRGIAVNTKEFRAEAAQFKTNLTDTTNQLKIQTKEIQAAEKATGGFTQSVGKAYGGLRLLANLIPGLGIGSLIGIIAGPLIDAFRGLASEVDEVTRKQKILQEINETAVKSYAAEGVRLDFIRAKLNDLNIPAEKRIAIAKEYNKTADESNKIDLKQIDNIALVNQAIDSQIAKIKERAFARASESIIAERSEKLFLAREQARLDNLQFAKDATRPIGGKKGNLMEQYVNSLQEQRILAEQIKKDPRVIAAEKNLQDALDVGAPFITVDSLTGKGDKTKTKTKTERARKEVTNIYEQELQKLRADIAKISEKGFTDEKSISDAIEEDFKKRALALREAAGKGQLREDQLIRLIGADPKKIEGKLGELLFLTISKELKDFQEKRALFLSQIESELDTLQIEANTKRISTIQDRFERERQLILSETDKTIDTLGNKRDKLIADITKNAAKIGLSPADVAKQIEEIKKTYAGLLDEILIIRDQRLQQSGFEVFESLSADAKRLLDAGNLGISQGSLVAIQQQATLFSQGKISYEQYQKELTEIAKAEANERFKIEKLFLEGEIKRRKEKLESDKTLTADQVKKLQDEVRRLEQQLVDAEKGNITSGGKKKPNETDPRLNSLEKYAQAIGTLTVSIISFWQEANKAEEAALDRSIALQEKRVEAAQRIAARGNAQYLKAEEDRLKQLQVARENAARRDLAINAALQASQLLVGITGAISKLASSPLGAAQVIGEIAIIFSALATGYGLVKSLQGQQPRLAKGTKYLQRDGHPAGVDTIPAYLNEGEAVIPTDRNKEYHPAIEAIYDKTIPSQALNDFVRTFHKPKPLPLPNYGRMKEAAELHIGKDGQMSVLLSEQNRKLDENNDLQRQVLRAMKNMSVSANIDRDGVAIAVNEYIQKMQIDRKT